MDRLVVLGSVNMDLVGAVPRLPIRGETVLGSTLVQLPGGKGANQAVAAARLGAEVTLVGRVGDDPYGSALIEHLQREPIGELQIEQDHDRPSGIAIVLVDDQDGDNMIAVFPGCNDSIGEREVSRTANSLSANSLLLLQLEIPMRTVRLAIESARAKGARIVLNAAPATNLAADLLSLVDVCVLNETEASAVLGWPVANVESASQAIRALLDWGVALAIVTLGAEGAVFSENGRAHHLEAPPLPVVDTTGAGDAFVGALCAALLNGREPAEAVSLASAAGAAAITKTGAQTALPYPGDLKDLLGLEWPGLANHATSHTLQVGSDPSRGTGT